MDCDSISFQPAIQLMGTPFDFCIILTFISEGYNWNKYSRLDLDCWIFSCYGLNLFDFHCQRFGYITCQNVSFNISTPGQNSPISEYILNPLICGILYAKELGLSWIYQWSITEYFFPAHLKIMYHVENSIFCF